MEDSREMAMMEDHGRLFREQLNSFLNRGSGELSREELRHLLYMAASHKVISHTVMNPVLWGSLSSELLLRVLAYLPVCEITRLRCHLSKKWTLNMEFDQACDKANPNMAALVSPTSEANGFSVRILDFGKCVWLYDYCFRLADWGIAPSKFRCLWMLMASDGGLVCLVSTWKYTEVNPLCIVVINPLTRVEYELPALNMFTLSYPHWCT